MDELITLWEKPEANKLYMIAGWHQWADAGSISSGLPQYLIEYTGARKIGEIASDGFYLFQIPGTHHFLRPEIQFKEGYRQERRVKKNEIFYTGDDQTGLFIFLGEEPHLNVDRYAEAFFSLIDALGVSRVAAVGGVYGAMPYDKDREVSSVYSMTRLKKELAQYAVKFSNYEGGATIGSYLVDKAEEKELEFFTFYAFVPAYDFSQLSALVQGVRIENDYKAWYELMRRFNHMFDLGIDLTELQREMDELTASMDAKIEELEKKMPQLKIKEYLAKLTEDFTEMPFMLLDDVWERELGDLLDNIDE
jgi:predicted ATP-grasp superfamily ATP-dependent carboligase